MTSELTPDLTPVFLHRVYRQSVSPTPSAFSPKILHLPAHPHPLINGIPLDHPPLDTDTFRSMNLVKRRLNFFGEGRISGLVTMQDKPVSRMIKLFDMRTGILVDQTWSKVDGSYQFNFIDPQLSWMIVAIDHMNQFNAVILDHVMATVKQLPAP